jgi:hypothetical protein
MPGANIMFIRVSIWGAYGHAAHISGIFLVIDESELSALPALMKKRCGII